MDSLFQYSIAGADLRAPLSIAYVEGSRLGATLADSQAIAVIRFGRETRVAADDSRLVTVGLPELGDSETLEVWRSPYPLRPGADGDVRFVSNTEVLFVCLLVDETRFSDLEQATCATYLRLLDVVHRQGYPCLARVWNYFPDINLNQNGLERYQAFCRGRYTALTQHLRDFETTLPAACAIGTRSPGLLIYGLATKAPGVQIENPRQLSAFRYPRAYGPRSPSFSRAILKPWGHLSNHLYVSGTASIVGHATRHCQNVTAQLQETLDNLEALLDNANRCLSSQEVHLSLLKIYVRHALDIEPLRDQITERFGITLPMLFLQGDICRSDLLIEIEGLGIGPMGSGKESNASSAC